MFESYAHSLGKDEVILAYLSQMAHLYVVRDAVVAEFVFHKIAGLSDGGQKLNRICALALLKWCTLEQGALPKEWELAETILCQLVREGRCFAFFESLPGKLREKYMLHDRVVVEYRTSPQAKVYINYLPVGYTKYVECEMEQMYEGVFAKEFIVFYEENIPYYIKEENDGAYKVTESGQIVRPSLVDGGEEGRLVLIDDMMASWQMKDEATLWKRLETYGQKEEMVKREFTLL